MSAATETVEVSAVERAQQEPGSTGRIVENRLAYQLAAGLAVVVATGAALTFFVDGVLGGPPVSNGNARGTALVELVLAVPLLVVSTVLAHRGSARGVITWLGATGYLLYNSLMFLFATPFNSLFLLYVAAFSLCIWSAILVLSHTDIAALGSQCSPTAPVRAIAIYAWVVVGLNLLVWLKGIVPAMTNDVPTSFLEGSGMTTSPVYVQDLAIWFPLTATAALLLWRKRPWGFLLSGAVLVMLVIEAIGVATDQWFGYVADPNTPFAAKEAAIGFVVLAAVGSIPVTILLRNICHRGARSGVRERVRVSATDRVLERNAMTSGR